MMLAATPSWFADNIVAISAVTLLVLTILVIRMVTTLALRVVLLAVIAGVGLFVYANRFALEACAETCKCELVDQDITLPACDVDLTS